MPDVGNDELLHVNDKNHFFLLNITKTSRTHAPKTEKLYLNYPFKRNENSYVQHLTESVS